jgi:hypothetical protein
MTRKPRPICLEHEWYTSREIGGDGATHCRRCGICPEDLVYQPSQRLIDLVDELIGLSVIRHYDRTADEHMTECRLCGGWEEHRDECLIPAAERWMAREP